MLSHSSCTICRQLLLGTSFLFLIRCLGLRFSIQVRSRLREGHGITLSSSLCCSSRLFTFLSLCAGALSCCWKIHYWLQLCVNRGGAWYGPLQRGSNAMTTQLKKWGGLSMPHGCWSIVESLKGGAGIIIQTFHAVRPESFYPLWSTQHR